MLFAAGDDTAVGKVYNLGSGEVIALKDLALLIKLHAEAGGACYS